MTSILSETLAPPRIAANGRSGASSSFESISISRSMSRPGVGRQDLRRSPTVEAWARWAVPNASLT